MSKTVWINSMHKRQRDIAALIRSGSANGIAVVASHRRFREDIFMMADEHFVEPATDEAEFDYAGWAVDRAVEGRWNAMMAIRHQTELIAARARFDAAGVRLAAGAMAPDAVALCEHKDRFTAEMLDAGIPVVETVSVDDVDQLRAAIARIRETGTEACVKPAVGIFGRGFWRFVDGLDPFAQYSTLEANEVAPEIYVEAYSRAAAPARQIVMQYLPGIESSIDSVCDDGVIVAHAVRQKYGEQQVVFTGGPEVEVARAVAARLRLDGLVNIQTKADAQGRPFLLEVNTRPSGGVAFSVAAGINLPYACARMVLGERVPDTTLSDPVVIRRLDETIVLPLATAALRLERAA